MVITHDARRRRLMRGSTVDVRADGGTSLIELVVGMTVLSIFLSMFTGAVIMMNQATNKAQSVSTSSLQLNQAFLSLDKTVRYAAAISSPGRCTGSTCTPADWYVEFLMTNVSPQRCTQLRVDSNQLQARSWDPASPPPVSAQFIALASGVTNGTSTDPDPFVPTATAVNQQLTITLAARSGSASTQATTSQSAFTFSALNSSIPPVTSPNCLLAGRS